MNKEKILDPFGNEIIETSSGFKIISGSVWRALCDVEKNDSLDEENWQYKENQYTEGLRSQKGIFVNDAFIPLWYKKERLIFLDGGYGSSKTTFAITKLLVECIESKYFRCFYGRQKKTEARELHKNIIYEIIRNGWSEDFVYSTQPTGSTQILHKATGNTFEMFGCDDEDSLKGWNNPTHILIDEVNQIEWKMFGMMFTRLRGNHRTQLWGCFNNCDVYSGHWLLDYIYLDEGEKINTEDIDKDEATLLNALQKTGIVRHHSTYLDNKFQNEKQYYYSLVIKAGKNPELIQAYCDGAWGVKLNGQPYYKDFKRSVHVKSVQYDPNLPLHISFDENTNPYFPFVISQIKGTEVRVIDEIIGINPNNKLTWMCREVLNRYGEHQAGVYIYGDATSVKDDVKLERGKNLFTMTADYLRSLNPTIRKKDANPNNKLRQDFINIIFAEEYEMIVININPKCKKTIEDLVNVEENPDGSKGGKNKAKVMVNGIAGVQRWGHCGDALEYFLCEAFYAAFTKFQKKGGMYKPKGGVRATINSLEHAEEQVIQEVKEERPRYQPYQRVSKNGY